MKWKYRPSIKLPYNTQMHVYCTFQRLREQPEERQNELKLLVDKFGGEHANALLRAMTTRDSLRRIAIDTYICESTLCRLVHRFYVEAAKTI